MALRNILSEQDPLLSKTCRPVTEFNERLHTLLDDMHETLLDSNGVGLAAPQVGVLRRAFLVLETNVEEGEEEFIVEILNPEIVETEGDQYGPEGCLSVPNLFGLVHRPSRVKVRGQDRFGQPMEYEGFDLTARALVHENDHLDGHLFVERADKLLTPEELQAYYAENGEDEADGEEAAEE